MKRKFLAAREDLVEMIKKIAERKNITLYALANEAIEYFIKAEQTGEPLGQIIERYRLIKTVKEAGFTLTPENVWFAFLHQETETESSLTKLWKESGEWFGKFCQTKFSPDSNLETLTKILNIVLWDFSDFAITKNNNKINVRCVGSRTPKNYTNLIAFFIQGVFETYNYTLIAKDISRGIIAINFVERKV